MLPSPRIGLIAIATISVAGAAAEAQGADCTYDRCALRVQYRGADMSVVQGIDANPIARIGIFAPDIEPLAGGSDETKAHYALFRSAQTRAGGFRLVAATLSVASAVIYLLDTQENDGIAFGLALGSIPFTIVASISTGKARDHLQQAIWFFNRALVRGP